jgi:hypothetical protein
VARIAGKTFWDITFADRQSNERTLCLKLVKVSESTQSTKSEKDFKDNDVISRYKDDQFNKSTLKYNFQMGLT